MEEEEERGEGLVVSDGDSLREMGSPRTPVQRRKKQMVVLGLFSRFCLSVVLQVLVLSSKQINVACRGCVMFIACTVLTFGHPLGVEQLKG